MVCARLLTRGNSFRVHCFCLRFVDDRHLVLRLSKYGKVFDFLIWEFSFRYCQLVLLPLLKLLDSFSGIVNKSIGQRAKEKH